MALPPCGRITKPVPKKYIFISFWPFHVTLQTGKLLEEIMKYCNEEKENSKKENFMCIEG